MSDYLIQVGDTSIEATSVVNNVAIYNVVVDIVRNTITTGALGNTKTPVTVVASMLCAIKWTNAKERILFNKKTQFLDAVLRCRVPAGVTIVKSDIVSYKSENYEIVDVVDYRNLGTLLVIGLRKVS